MSETRPLDGTRVLACFGHFWMGGGLEIQSFEVLRALQDAGAAIHVVTNDWPADDDPPTPHRIKAMVRRLGASHSTGRYRSWLRKTWNPVEWFQALYDVAVSSLQLLRDARRFRPTHLLVPDYLTAVRIFPALLWSRLRRRKVILRVGNVPERKRSHQVLWRRVLPWAVDEFVANSLFGLRRLQETGLPPARIACVRNAVATRANAATLPPETLEFLRQRPTVVCLGQIAPFKGTHHAIAATEKLLAEGRDFQLAIVGRMPNWPAELAAYGAELERAAAGADPAGRIRFLGEIGDVPGLLAETYLMVAPIEQEETFGNVALEAKVAGVPAVVTPRGGLIELVDHRRTGWIAAAADADSVAAGMAHFLDDPAARAAASAACRAELDDSACPDRRDVFEFGWRGRFTLPPTAGDVSGLKLESAR
ncbi:MAG TPA: glycosyltransferase family 4 protein [Planctomycetia bacterium]|nr:glycosyltransferase family 4 protein [Planctomycetia bacterium]